MDDMYSGDMRWQLVDAVVGEDIELAKHLLEKGASWVLLVSRICLFTLCVLPSDDGTVAGDSGGSH